MSEKPENNQVSEQNLEQAAGGMGEDVIRRYVFCCLKCHAARYIDSATFPAELPTCCGNAMFFVGI